MGALDIAAGAAGGALGIATAGWQDKRQLKQQEKLQELAMKGQKEMSEFNQGLAIDTWEKTNAAAQRKQLEKAGLNVGLMYGGPGGGGRTTAQPGTVGGATAPVDVVS